MNYDILVQFLDPNTPDIIYTNVTYVIANGFLTVTEPGPPPATTGHNLATISTYVITEHEAPPPPV